MAFADFDFSSSKFKNFLTIAPSSKIPKGGIPWMFKFAYRKAIKLSPNTCVSLSKKMWCIAISGHHGT